MLVLSKEIKEKEIRNHPDRSKLLRVIGGNEEPKCDIAKPIKLKGNLSFLLCSDGYWELVKDKDIEATNRAAVDTDEWIDTLSALVRTNGEGVDMDNFTAVAVWIEDGDIIIENREDFDKQKIFKVRFEEPGEWDTFSRRERRRIQAIKERAKAATEAKAERVKKEEVYVGESPARNATEIISEIPETSEEKAEEPEAKTEETAE